MTEHLGQQFVLDNRGGASGSIAAAYFATSAPDGYTVMAHSASHIANAYMYKKLSYDTLNDFIGVTTLAKQIRAIGVTSEQRVKQFPDIPAIGESVPGFEFTAWAGCFVPAGTPRNIVDKLNSELRKALADPGVAAKLNALTLEPIYTTPQEFALRLKSDYEKYGKIIKLSGAKVN